ncbi:MAG: hypothetical protein K8R23_20450 [Chthoniobacter sp.]|nr:hypothetical protein [Chthoniobacter sp.]
MQRDDHGRKSAQPVSAPDVQRVGYTSAARDEIALEFDQPVEWADALAAQFYLDAVAGKVTSGVANGNVITLKLAAPTDAKTLTYVVDKTWDHKTVLFGKNGIAALTFWEVPILEARK